MPRPIRRVVTGHDAAGRSAAFDRGSPRHSGFHKTSSVDYAIVLSGEIYALMDEGEVLLKAGDVLVQRGTNHAWSNRGDESAYVAFVLIDAEPV
jgi:quercetin dioxygenase-like cupin family protein